MFVVASDILRSPFPSQEVERRGKGSEIHFNSCLPESFETCSCLQTTREEYVPDKSIDKQFLRFPSGHKNCRLSSAFLILFVPVCGCNFRSICPS